MDRRKSLNTKPASVLGWSMPGSVLNPYFPIWGWESIPGAESSGLQDLLQHLPGSGILRQVAEFDMGSPPVNSSQGPSWSRRTGTDAGSRENGRALRKTVVQHGQEGWAK
ncbi:MAG TPA: hypothetical protein DEO88_03525 [Syntrophobacteraceae bacterium]|nr:hypothetical protein [Syntrophobacteraceae bacterium]